MMSDDDILEMKDQVEAEQEAGGDEDADTGDDF